MQRPTTLLFAGASLVALSPAAAQQALPQANDSYFTAAKAALEQHLQMQPITGTARNVILFVGDGMSIPTITAARIYEGQKRGVDGESNNLVTDTFPYSAFSKTYSNDGQMSDSAPTATAMVTGVKANNGTLGVNASVLEGDCAAGLKGGVTSIFEQAEAEGRATGVISTARITHATPAATYAHTAFRDWESDKELSDEAKAAAARTSPAS